MWAMFGSRDDGVQNSHLVRYAEKSPTLFPLQQELIVTLALCCSWTKIK